MEKLELKIEAVRLKESGFIGSTSTAGEGEKYPIYLSVDTGFDYTALTTAIIGFVVAVVVAKFTVNVQRNQIQANISNFRHHWMVELRECASEFLQVVASIMNEASRSADYRSGVEYMAHHSRAMQLRARIDLLMSRDDEQSRNVRKSCGDLIDAVCRTKPGEDINPKITKIVEFENLLRAELEEAWVDTKHDLGLKQRSFGIKIIK